jgi:hypothetical protein
VHLYRLISTNPLNPTQIPKQTLNQDRCHRIGQTREVHIYRLISTNTIEENILRKSDQKRQLDWLAIQSGGFNTEVLAKALASEFGGRGEGGARGEGAALARVWGGSQGERGRGWGGVTAEVLASEFALLRGEGGRGQTQRCWL